MATRTKSPAGEAAEAQWGAVPAGQALAPPAGEDDEIVEQSPIERVMVALSDAVEPGKRVRLQLYRRVPGGAGKPDREEWCADLTPDEFEQGGLSAIRDAWGPGDYVAHLMGYKRGSTYFTRIASPRFSLAPIPGMARAHDSQSAGLEAALRSLAENQSRTLEALIEMRSAPPVNPMNQMRETLTLMTAMREAMGINGQAQPQQKSTIGELVDAIKEMREASSIFNAKGGEEKSTLSEIMDLAKPVIGMVQSAMQASAQSNTHTVPQMRIPQSFEGVQNAVLPTEQSVQIPERRVEEEPRASSESQVAASAIAHSGEKDGKAGNEDEKEILAQLTGYLESLVTMAARSASVEEGAALVYDKLPDDWIELLHMPIWWSALSSAAPNVATHEAWFTAVRNRVVEMFAEDENDAANQEVAVKSS